MAGLQSFTDAVKAKTFNFGEAAPLLTQIQRKTLPITAKQAMEM